MSTAPARPLAALKLALRQLRAEKQSQRCLYSTATTTTTIATASSTTTTSGTLPPGNRPSNFHPGAIMTGRNNPHKMKKIPIYPNIPSSRAVCVDPVATLTTSQLLTLDPNGQRTRLFSPTNPDRVNPGDILLVKLRSGDQFAGVCLNIRSRGIDTAILLRNQLTRVGVEMWYKIYSPNVEGIEVVQRKEKRARRARLYYMRKPKHDVGSVDGIVRQYLRQRGTARVEGVKGRGANAGKKKNNSRGSN